jgi:dienelactone hydrolase
VIAAWATRWRSAAIGVLALGLIAISLNALLVQDVAVERRHGLVGETPVSVYTPAVPAPPTDGPVIVIAHGFAGSQQLMQAYAQAIARHGYTALTFDFLGHGRHRSPLVGSIVEESGATQALLAQLEAVVGYALELGGREHGLGLLGHSMAADILVRFTQPRELDTAAAWGEGTTASGWAGGEHVAGMVGVSMFAPTITATTPPNLLAIAGQFEPRLIEEALRVAAQVAPDADAVMAGVTYGEREAQSLRRVLVAPGAEHVAVLYQRQALREAVQWFDQVFARPVRDPQVPARGLAILGLLGGLVLLAWPLSGALPVVRVVERQPPPSRRVRAWRRYWLIAVAPALLTPLLLWPVPTGFLPVLVADYLALHFGVYGALTALLLLRAARIDGVASPRGGGMRRAGVGALAVALVLFYGLAVIGHAIDTWLTAFLVTPVRVPLFLAILPGTLLYFLADEWFTRHVAPVPGGYLCSKIAFLASLALAVALDFSGLFFLLIIVPVIVLFFTVYGVFSRWVHVRTGVPWVAGLANAVVFAWALAVTFPLLGD